MKLKIKMFFGFVFTFFFRDFVLPINKHNAFIILKEVFLIYSINILIVATTFHVRLLKLC